jgi:Tol biopolymer transport system component/chitodextrinase
MTCRLSHALSALTCAAMAAACGGTEPSNTPPVAAFATHCGQLVCVFENASTDEDGTIAAFAWNFGDGATSTDANPTHAYAAPGGDFTVTVVVTDNDGGAATLSRKLVVSVDSLSPAELPPVAAFSVSCFGLACTFTDQSTDPDAADSVVAWTWSFGDGATSTETSPAHTYDAPGGRFTATLTVSDTRGAAATATQAMFVASDSPPPVAGQIAFSREGRIYRVNTDGTGLVQLSAGPADSEPAWSPDGSRIAFSRGGDAGGIYVMTADGVNPVRRADAGGSPTWSPDGQWVAFSCRVGGDGGICKVRADDDGTAPVTALVRAGAVAYPAWSPDGTRIAYSSDWNLFDFWLDLWVASLDGSEPTRLPRNNDPFPRSDEVQPAWSPDGQRIAVMECPWGFEFCSTGDVEVMNADGSGIVRVGAAIGFAHPTWSPDGQYIAFASANSIRWVRADGNQLGRIITNGTSPAWRPR